MKKEAKEEERAINAEVLVKVKSEVKVSLVVKEVE
jgi:hypothetical protein